MTTVSPLDLREYREYRDTSYQDRPETITEYAREWLTIEVDCDDFAEKLERCGYVRTLDDALSDARECETLAERKEAIDDWYHEPVDVLNSGLSYSEMIELGLIEKNEHIPDAAYISLEEWAERRRKAREAKRALRLEHRRGRARTGIPARRATDSERLSRQQNRPRRASSSTRRIMPRARSHSRTRRAATVSRGSPPKSDSDPDPPEQTAHSPPFSCPPWPSDTSTAAGLIVAYLHRHADRLHHVGRDMSSDAQTGREQKGATHGSETRYETV